jgi:acetyl esterase/lipase
MLQRMKLLTAEIAFIMLALCTAGLHAQDAKKDARVAKQKRQPEKPAPNIADEKYGPHERNVIDLWKAKSDRPTPLVVFIHGGGFRAGDKSQLSPALLKGCLDSGISVAAINYRLSQHAPFPAPMLDSGRAIQYLRAHATAWNLDATRIAATGGSAGAGISLWLGFHDDLADPKSDDPVARHSTRLTCMAVNGAQSSYDPRDIKAWIGGRAHEHPALVPFFGLKPDERDSPRAHKLYEEASAINYVTPDDPPVFMFYTEPKGPLPDDAPAGQGIHHVNFGLRLKEKLDPHKIECIVRHRDDYEGGRVSVDRDMVEFFRKHFKLPKSPQG